MPTFQRIMISKINPTKKAAITERQRLAVVVMIEQTPHS